MTTESSRTTILARRSKESCHCHPGPVWVVGCPECGRDAWAWRYGRPGEPRSSGWSCIYCGKRGGLFKIEEPAA
ncbi:MAG TPA: hypothetical protein VMN39_12065 [Longimicrobiaceae bacterium]|nr:hypothetical protein [Longimicrobiaceae bacterium]